MEKKLKDLFGGFYAGKDAAHGLDHILEVQANLRLIVRNHERLGFPLDKDIQRIAHVAVWAHDIFAEERKEHHMLSARYVRENALELIRELGLSLEEVERVAVACEQHRSSYKGLRSDPAAVLMAAADYGCQHWLPFWKRSMLYTLDHNPHRSIGWCADESAWHTLDKCLGVGDEYDISIIKEDMYRIGYGSCWTSRFEDMRRAAVEGIGTLDSHRAVVIALGRSHIGK